MKTSLLLDKLATDLMFSIWACCNHHKESVYTGTYLYIHVVHTSSYQNVLVHTGTYWYILVQTGTYEPQGIDMRCCQCYPTTLSHGLCVKYYEPSRNSILPFCLSCLADSSGGDPGGRQHSVRGTLCVPRNPVLDLFQCFLIHRGACMYKPAYTRMCMCILAHISRYQFIHVHTCSYHIF
jgi:hypothetical protein